MAQIDDFRPCEMTDYWKDRRPPAERLPDCERLLEAAQEDISRYRGTIDILHGHIKTIEAEIERLQAERDELLKVARVAAKYARSKDNYFLAEQIEIVSRSEGQSDD